MLEAKLWMLKWRGEIFVLSKMHCIQFCFGGVPSWAYVSVCSMQFSVNDVDESTKRTAVEMYVIEAEGVRQY